MRTPPAAPSVYWPQPPKALQPKTAHGSPLAAARQDINGARPAAHAVVHAPFLPCTRPLPPPAVANARILPVPKVNAPRGPQAVQPNAPRVRVPPPPPVTHATAHAAREPRAFTSPPPLRTSPPAPRVSPVAKGLQAKPAVTTVAGARPLAPPAPRLSAQPPANNFQARPPVLQPFEFTYTIGFVEKIIDTETYVKGTYPDDEPGMAKWLDFILKSGVYAGSSGGFSQLVDLTSTDRREIRDFIKEYSGAKVKGPSRRQMFGYANPSHDSELGLEMLEEGAHTPYNKNRWVDKEDWLLSPNRNFYTYSPNSRTLDPGLTKNHTNVVLGHDEGASNHWNRRGHKMTRFQNQRYNNSRNAYHGLERRDKSNKSGGKAPRYKRPNQKRGSHQMWWDQSHKNYKQEYQNW